MQGNSPFDNDSDDEEEENPFSSFSADADDDDAADNANDADNGETTDDDQQDSQPSANPTAPARFERVERSLGKPYTRSKTVAGVDVTLSVSEVTLRRDAAQQSIGGSPTQVLVGAEGLFRDVARATEYTVTANGETVIDGGDEFSVRWLESKLMDEVGATRRVKEELMDAGFDADELDETAQAAESAVVQFYRNIDIKDAELIAKSIAFNAADADIEGADDLPETAEVREWVNDARAQLDAAEDALDDIESMARDLLGDDEYENATLTPDNDADDDSDTDDDEDDGLTTDLEEIRTQMYDEGMTGRSARLFAEREETLSSGETLKVNTGPLMHEIVLEDEDGNTETLDRTDSEAEAVKVFNEELRDRR